MPSTILIFEMCLSALQINDKEVTKWTVSLGHNIRSHSLDEAGCSVSVRWLTDVSFTHEYPTMSTDPS